MANINYRQMAKQFFQLIWCLISSNKDIDDFFGKRNIYIHSSDPAQEVRVGTFRAKYSILAIISIFIGIIRCTLLFILYDHPEFDIYYGESVRGYGPEGKLFGILAILYCISACGAQLSFHLCIGQRFYPFWTRVFKFDSLTTRSRTQCSLFLNFIDRAKFLAFRSVYLKFIQVFEVFLLLLAIIANLQLYLHNGSPLIWTIWLVHNLQICMTLIHLGFTLPSLLFIIFVYVQLRFSIILIEITKLGARLKKQKNCCSKSFEHRLDDLTNNFAELCCELSKFNAFWKIYIFWPFFAGFSSICLLFFLTTAGRVDLKYKLVYTCIMLTAFIYAVAGPFFLGALMFHKVQKINKKFLIIARYKMNPKIKFQILSTCDNIAGFKGFTCFDIFHFSKNGFLWMMLRMLRYLLLTFKRLGR